MIRGTCDRHHRLGRLVDGVFTHDDGSGCDGLTVKPLTRGVFPIRRGWWNLPCWNALSIEQQTRLIEVGNLPFGYMPEGTGCTRGAQVAVETEDDRAEGPRFYCRQCAASYILRLEPA